MLPGIAPVIGGPANLLQIDTANYKATDFRNHNVGTPLDWEQADPSESVTLSITNSGAVSTKALEASLASSGIYTLFQWNRSASVSTDDQEVLALYEPLVSPSGSVLTLQFGPSLKTLYTPTANWVGGGIGRNGTTNSSIRQATLNGTTEVGAGNFTWAANTRYWTRLRISATRQISRKVWADGSSEPASFTTATAASTAWPTAAGLAAFRIGHPSTAPSVRLHFISVAYNGNTALAPNQI